MASVQPDIQVNDSEEEEVETGLNVAVGQRNSTKSSYHQLKRQRSEEVTERHLSPDFSSRAEKKQKFAHRVQGKVKKGSGWEWNKVEIMIVFTAPAVQKTSLHSQHVDEVYPLRPGGHGGILLTKDHPRVEERSPHFLAMQHHDATVVVQKISPEGELVSDDLERTLIVFAPNEILISTDSNPDAGSRIGGARSWGKQQCRGCPFSNATDDDGNRFWAYDERVAAKSKLNDTRINPHDVPTRGGPEHLSSHQGNPVGFANSCGNGAMSYFARAITRCYLPTAPGTRRNFTPSFLGSWLGSYYIPPSQPVPSAPVDPAPPAVLPPLVLPITDVDEQYCDTSNNEDDVSLGSEVDDTDSDEGDWEDELDVDGVDSEEDVRDAGADADGLREEKEDEDLDIGLLPDDDLQDSASPSASTPSSTVSDGISSSRMSSSSTAHNPLFNEALNGADFFLGIAGAVNEYWMWQAAVNLSSPSILDRWTSSEGEEVGMPAIQW